MALTPFILLPLYIYPEAGLWDPLFSAASTYPDVNFQVIVNPWTGPGEGSCPDDAFTTAMQQVQNYSNIKTLGYVHTANAWDCGDSGSDICVTSAPMEQLKANVTTYANWGSEECGSVPIDGIFFDEAPSTSKSDYIDYMREASTFAKSTLTSVDETTMFNAGTRVVDAYWELADYICVLEDSETAFDTVTDLGEVNGDGVYADQATFILYDYESGTVQLKADVQKVFDAGVAGLSVTDTDGYVSWGGDWMDFVGVVDEVVNGGGS